MPIAFAWLQAIILGAIMVAAVAIAWRSFGQRASILDATTPGHVFLVFFFASTAFGSIVVLVDGEGTSGGAMLAAGGLVAFAVGAAVAARISGIPDPPGPPAEVGRINERAVLVLAGLGMAAYVAIAVRFGIPFLSHDAQGVRAAYNGLIFDVFRWLVPPAALVAMAIALARGGRRDWAVAIAANGGLVFLMFLTASRALPFELATAIILLALWAGRRVARRTWLALAGAALVFFVGVQLLRVSQEGGFRDLPDVGQFVVGRTFDRVALIQARALEVVATRIPSQHPFYGGSTYVRWLATVRGEPQPQALGFWIYDQIYPDQPGGFATPGILGELWANGGVPLVAVGMALFGAIAQLLGTFISRLDRGAADRVFAALLVVAVGRMYATSLNGVLLTVAVVVAWRIVVTLPDLPGWLPVGSGPRRVGSAEP
jgi:hypothetical protein